MGDFTYDQLVVIAESEWSLGYVNSSVSENRRTTFSTTVGNIEWEITSNDNGNDEKSCSFSCKSVIDGLADEVHAEIHGYWGKTVSELITGVTRDTGISYVTRTINGISYFGDKNKTSTPLRHIFKQNDYTLSFKQQIPCVGGILLFTIRILKDRVLFPNFKLDTVKIGHLESNVKLRVVDQIFNANKEVLSMYSKVFGGIFDEKFRDAKQEEVELNHDPADPALFEYFLLVLCVQDALPNRKNLIGLFKLADYYDADNVREKCERHFRMCREMPVGERYLLALELGNAQLQDLIMKNVDLDKAKNVIGALKERLEELTNNNKKTTD